MSREALLACLARDGDQLVERVLAATYRDPFWHARYGLRASKHGREDGRFHFAYVAQALAADDPAIMERYARWLQAVLATRGMCTRHLAENFDRLADAVRQESWPDGEAAVAMLTAARAALRYPSSPACVVQECTAELAAASADAACGAHPEWPSDLRARAGDDLTTLLSYAADALALGDARTFGEHVAWLRPFLARQGLPADYLDACLAALANGSAAPRALADLVASAAVNPGAGAPRR